MLRHFHMKMNCMLFFFNISILLTYHFSYWYIYILVKKKNYGKKWWEELTGLREAPSPFANNKRNIKKQVSRRRVKFPRICIFLFDEISSKRRKKCIYNFFWMSQQIRTILTSLIIYFQWHDDGGNFKREHSGVFESNGLWIGLSKRSSANFSRPNWSIFVNNLWRLFTMDASVEWMLFFAGKD